MGDRVHDAEHVLGAMIDFAHEEVLLFLALLAFSNVLSGAGHAYGPSLTPHALEISNAKSLHPTDIAVSPQESELGRGTLWIDGVGPPPGGRPKAFAGGGDARVSSSFGYPPRSWQYRKFPDSAHPQRPCG